MPAAARPLVSVVVPTYDRPTYLRSAVQSVFDQTYDAVELLVVDDCSPRPAAPVLDEMNSDGRHRVRVIRHERNRGGSAARATGIGAAEGRYIAFLDDDDEWLPTKLEKQVAVFDAYPEVGLVYTGSQVIDGNGDELESVLPVAHGNLTKTLLCENVIGSFSNVMVRRALVEEVGTPDERFPSWQDLEWYVRLSRHCSFAGIREPLIRYQTDSPGRITDDVDDALVSRRLFVEKFDPLAREYGRLFGRKFRAWAAYRVGRLLVMHGEFDRARPLLVSAVRLYPFEPAFVTFLLPTLGGERAYRLLKSAKRRVGVHT
ncbi:glycosyltransferase family 2 protein [Haloprofundus salinisoli]|uniref:glycosyltransferase family 2 protein n=1 Tax=Haloprofundus salinisoli TaxID=2876193 RepID=UPI001CCD4DC5|nr:glycosyltransferase family 2 protein [Haloprofundus salinisoli]